MAPPTNARKVSVSLSSWILGGSLVNIEDVKPGKDGKYRKVSSKLAIKVDPAGHKVYADGTVKKIDKTPAPPPAPKPEAKAEPKPKGTGILKKTQTKGGNDGEAEFVEKTCCGKCGKTMKSKEEGAKCVKHAKGETESKSKDSKKDESKSKDDKEKSEDKSDDTKDESKNEPKDDAKDGKNGKKEKADKNKKGEKGGYEWTNDKDTQLQALFTAKTPWPEIQKAMKTNRKTLARLEELEKKNEEEKVDKVDEEAAKAAAAAAIQAHNDAIEAMLEAQKPRFNTNIPFGEIFSGTFGGDPQDPTGRKAWDGTNTAPAPDAWDTAGDPKSNDNSDKPTPGGGWDNSAPAADNKDSSKPAEPEASGGGWNDDNPHVNGEAAVTSTPAADSWDAAANEANDTGGGGESWGAPETQPVAGSWDNANEKSDEKPADSGGDGWGTGDASGDTSGNKQSTETWDQPSGGAQPSSDAWDAPEGEKKDKTPKNTSDNKSKSEPSKQNKEQNSTSWGLDGANSPESQRSQTRKGNNPKNPTANNSWGGNASTKSHKSPVPGVDNWNSDNAHFQENNPGPSGGNLGTNTSSNDQSNQNNQGGWDSASGNNNSSSSQNKEDGWGATWGEKESSNDQSAQNNQNEWGGNAGNNTSSDNQNNENQRDWGDNSGNNATSNDQSNETQNGWGDNSGNNVASNEQSNQGTQNNWGDNSGNNNNSHKDSTGPSQGNWDDNSGKNQKSSSQQNWNRGNPHVNNNNGESQGSSSNNHPQHRSGDNPSAMKGKWIFVSGDSSDENTNKQTTSPLAKNNQGFEYQHVSNNNQNRSSSNNNGPPSQVPQSGPPPTGKGCSFKKVSSQKHGLPAGVDGYTWVPDTPQNNTRNDTPRSRDSDDLGIMHGQGGHWVRNDNSRAPKRDNREGKTQRPLIIHSEGGYYRYDGPCQLECCREAPKPTPESRWPEYGFSPPVHQHPRVSSRDYQYQSNHQSPPPQEVHEKWVSHEAFPQAHTHNKYFGSQKHLAPHARPQAEYQNRNFSAPLYDHTPEFYSRNTYEPPRRRSPSPPPAPPTPEWIGQGMQNPHWQPQLHQTSTSTPPPQPISSDSLPSYMRFKTHDRSRNEFPRSRHVSSNQEVKHVQFTSNTNGDTQPSSSSRNMGSGSHRNADVSSSSRTVRNAKHRDVYSLSSSRNVSSSANHDIWATHSAYTEPKRSSPPPARFEPLHSVFEPTSPVVTSPHSSFGHTYDAPGAFPSSPVKPSKRTDGCAPTIVLVPHLKPDNVWSKQDCEILEHLCAKP